MGADFYVYAYLLLSLAYVALGVAYLSTVTRTASLMKARRRPEADAANRALEDTEEQEHALIAVRAALGVDSAAFACAVLPVAYVAVSGLLGTIVSRNPASASALNLLWLALSVAVVIVQGIFLARIVDSNGRLSRIEHPTLTASFVNRHVSMLTYYRVFIAAVVAFTAINSLYIIANIDKFTIDKLYLL